MYDVLIHTYKAQFYEHFSGVQEMNRQEQIDEVSAMLTLTALQEPAIRDENSKKLAWILALGLATGGLLAEREQRLDNKDRAIQGLTAEYMPAAQAEYVQQLTGAARAQVERGLDTISLPVQHDTIRASAAAKAENWFGLQNAFLKAGETASGGLAALLGLAHIWGAIAGRRDKHKLQHTLDDLVAHAPQQ